MSIRLSELFERVRLLRQDVLPEQVSSALVEAARLLARDTNLLRDEVLFTLESGSSSATLVLPNNREVNRVFKVERHDDALTPPWVKLRGPCILRAQGSDIAELDPFVPDAWGGVEGEITFSGPADDYYAMKAKVAWIPGRTPIPEELPFPSKAEQALVSWAKHLLWEISGKGQNFKLADAAKKDYNAEISGLCAISQDGEGASRTINDWLPMER